MINTNEYITILFGFITVLIGIYVTIYFQKIKRSTKRKITIIATVISILSIIVLTIIYGYGRFDFSKLLPFGKQQFTDDLFIEKYKIYSMIYLAVLASCYITIYCQCGNIKYNLYLFRTEIFDKGYVTITILFHFPISAYAQIWIIYMLCSHSFSLIICILISLLVFTIEFCSLYFISKYLTFRKLRKTGFLFF